MKRLLAMAVFLLVGVAPAWANEVSILQADFTRDGDGWDIDVTLKHDDTGWRHYADIWRVVGEEGEVFATRTLLHPHEDEQPFTRGLSGVVIPHGRKVVYIEAHDTVHGWSHQRLRVDLSRAAGAGYRVRP